MLSYSVNVCLNAHCGIAMRQRPNYPIVQIPIGSFSLLLPLTKHVKSHFSPEQRDISHLEIRHICTGTWGTITDVSKDPAVEHLWPCSRNLRKKQDQQRQERLPLGPMQQRQEWLPGQVTSLGGRGAALGERWDGPSV